jgi:hypothetical protein
MPRLFLSRNIEGGKRPGRLGALLELSYHPRRQGTAAGRAGASRGRELWGALGRALPPTLRLEALLALQSAAAAANANAAVSTAGQPRCSRPHTLARSVCPLTTHGICMHATPLDPLDRMFRRRLRGGAGGAGSCGRCGGR